MPCPFCGGPYGFGGGLGMILSAIFFLILIVGIGLFIWWLVRQSSQAGAGPGATAGRAQTQRALEILDERYARGEISKDEYEERKKTLLGT